MSYSMVTSPKSSIFEPRVLVTDLINEELKSIIEAFNSPYWKTAMDDEYNTLI